MDPALILTEEVRDALETGRAVVALESTVIAHGLPSPRNLETALSMEEAVRRAGAVPATVAILGGRIHVGLTRPEIEHLATARPVRKVSRRDLPIVVARREDGATTVAATSTIAAWAGIAVFATGGIGGVHRDGPLKGPPDISNDLATLASVSVAVVCSGAKAILDLGATLEWLETAGVPVLGYGCDEFPAFYSRESGLAIDARVDSPEEAASIIRTSRQLGLPGGILLAVPVPKDQEVPAGEVEGAIEHALSEASSLGVTGSALTPFLLRCVADVTSGRALRANIALLHNNALVAGQIAVALSQPAAIPSRRSRP